MAVDLTLLRQAFDLLRESAGVIDREGKLLWANRPLQEQLGLGAPIGEEPIPVSEWVSTEGVPSLMRSLIAVETGLTPQGERISLEVRLAGRAALIASVQKLDDGLLLLIGRSRNRPGAPSSGLLASQADFLANMSHELRTPLNAIIGYAELLMLPDLPASDEQRRAYARDIRDSGRQLLEMIDDILEFAKVGSGRMTIRAADFDVVEELQGCLKVAEGVAHRLGRELTFELHAEDDVGTARSDVRLFKQIAVNLLSNAVKYNRDGGKVELAVRRAGKWLQIAVRDTGEGIPADEAERIFSAFYQVDGTASRAHGGMGLGLAICQRFLDLLGGGIRVQSKLGVGSTFTFHVPADARSIPTGKYAKARAITDTAELPALSDLLDG